MSCEIWAETPTIEFDVNNIGTISGTGHRECSGSVPQEARVQIRLRRHRRFWFNKTLASREFTGTNIRETVSYKCKGKGSQSVYSEIIVKTGKKKKTRSGRRNFSLCS
jgi:hypothetical protein